jgi:hypothetical protein
MYYLKLRGQRIRDGKVQLQLTYATTRRGDYRATKLDTTSHVLKSEM